MLFFNGDDDLAAQASVFATIRFLMLAEVALDASFGSTSAEAATVIGFGGKPGTQQTRDQVGAPSGSGGYGGFA